MGMLNLVGRSVVSSHEDVFLARYAALVAIALRVTDGDRQEAEDLVHEAFIRFTLVQPPLDDILNLDAYLSRMLRNMYTSQIRRQQRAAEAPLPIFDYDSLEIAFHATDARQQLEVRQDLRVACEYGCLRKRSSKSGSVFLLRFFHGYLPSEIARLSGLSPAIVDALIFRARGEVRPYVEDPRQLASLGEAVDASTNRPARATLEADSEAHAFVHELRARICRDAHERCWSKATLLDLYRDPSAEPLTRDSLADLVSCLACLDAVNARLGLPRLADRWPADTLGPGTRGGPRGGPRGGSPTGALAAARRLAGAVFEHRPRQLLVSVNGFVIGAHTVGAYDSDLTLSVTLNEPIALVELLSEQGLCLAFLDIVPPPDGSPRRRRRVELSDARHAQLEVTFAGPWPTVRASYSDPHRMTVIDFAEDRASERGAAADTPPVRSGAWRWPQLFDLHPARALAVLAILLVWLLFWTPGTTVSAAERIANTIRWLAGAMFGSPSVSTTTAPPAPAARAVAPPAAAIVSARPSALTDSRRTHLELKALAELQRVEAYLGQEVALAARDGAAVRLQAVVDTGGRRDVLLGALGSLRADPGLHTRVTVLADIAARPGQRPAANAARAFHFVADDFPMFATVRRYLRHQQTFQRAPRGATELDTVDDAALDTEARRFATAVLERSRRAAQHAWALKHLGDRFPPTLIEQASTDARTIWRGLIREHALAYQQELALLRRDLAPFAQTADAEVQSEGDPPATAPPSTSDAWNRIARLLEANRRQERATQYAFAIQSDASKDADGVEGAGLSALVDLCEALALEIASDHQPAIR